MAKISQIHHITRTGVVKHNPQKMPRRLPIITYKGKKYFVDFRLGELRDIKTANAIKFTALKEDPHSLLKTELRRLRWELNLPHEYIAGVDD